MSTAHDQKRYAAAVVAADWQMLQIGLPQRIISIGFSDRSLQRINIESILSAVIDHPRRKSIDQRTNRS